MRTEDFKILENICSMKEKELYRFVKTFLMSLPFNSFNEGNSFFLFLLTFTKLIIEIPSIDNINAITTSNSISVKPFLFFKI